ncbi:MAG: hypothetical protein C4K60_16535 [Ideonella sp. MAG2]|nr:MAG: hypothetical protein C4K60_16535 [Ideonella sp. MAG2]
MNESLQSFDLSGSMTQQRNRVLRNTYWLLALSMVPTVLGAWVGVSTGVVTGLSPIVSMVVFFAGAFGFMFAIERTIGETNYISATLALYLDVYNVFQSLLSLLGIFGGSDD